ncbi:MAG: helix-turn-helix transcriptional regulator [Planctomycetes bacterium]|nr:helix-turn-helix transcriptional regulator [Planctomycetota bacterium]
MKPALTDALLERIAARFRVLSEPARLRLLRRLLEGECSVGELAKSANLTQANTSKHLSVLLTAHFVARRSEGNVVFYRVDDPSLKDLCKVACEGFAARVEAEARALRSR